jgi:hypothetical protein
VVGREVHQPVRLALLQHDAERLRPDDGDRHAEGEPGERGEHQRRG